MAMYLKDILKQANDKLKGVRTSTTEPASTGKDPGVDYKPKSGDEADFVAKHSVQKWDEPYGNPNYADKVGYTIPKEKNHGNTEAKAKATNEEVQIDELSTDLLHRAAHKAAKVAMTDVQGRSGPIFKKRAAQANKFRAKGMEQEKKEKAAKAVKEENLNELSPATKKAYVAAATDDKKHAERQANHSEYTASHAKTAKQKSDFSSEAKWLKSIAAKRAKGIAMATKEETDPGFSESKKAEDIKCNNTPGQTWCPMHEMTDCSSARPIKEKDVKEAYDDNSTKVSDWSDKKLKWHASDDRKHSSSHVPAWSELRRRAKTSAPKPKVAKEEVEQIDEISDKLALSYAKGAEKSMDNASKKGSAGFETFQKRSKGHTLALDKTNPEHKRLQAKVGTSDANAKDAAYKKAVSEETIDERKLSPAEMKKREEVAQAIHKKDPSMSMDKKMAIATSTAKKITKISHYRADRDKHLEEDLAVPLLGGDHPPRGESEEAIEMVKAELKALANKAMHLVMQMPAGMHVEPWCQSKIAQAKSYVSDVHDYMIYGDHDKPEEDEQSDTPMTFPSMNVDAARI